MRFALTGGENCPTATVARFRRRWDHLSVAIGYGLTEAGVITWIRDEELDAHPDSVGRSFGAQTFRVVDAEGHPVPAGVTGEVVTAAPVVTSGYWNAPDLTDAAVRGGWLWTGDLGRVDDDDYLYISGRSKDMIISGGQNIYPAEIENALSEHTGLLEATIIGVPDPQWGETVCALVVPKDGVSLTDGDIVSFLQERLASYKKPRHVVFMDSLQRGDRANFDGMLEAFPNGSSEGNRGRLIAVNTDGMNLYRHPLPAAPDRPRRRLTGRSASGAAGR